MKKTTNLIFLLCVLSALLCVSALAAETASENLAAGFYFGSETTAGLTVTPTASSGETPEEKTVEIDGTRYAYFAGADKLSVSAASGQAGKEYLVMLVEGTFETAPTADNKILYIDQVSQTSDGAVAFDVFPIIPDKTTPLTLFVTSNDGSAMRKQVLYYGAEGAYDVLQYTLGDVNDDGFWNSTDASIVLQIAAELILNPTETQRLAANVNHDEFVNSTDASLILQYGAGLITEFPTANN